jgi:hypothetical protein
MKKFSLKQKIGLAVGTLLALAVLAFAAAPHLTANILDLTTGFTLGGGSMISSTTGTGSLVLSTSPTITSPTISGLTLSGTTAVSTLTIGGGTALTTSNQTGTGSLVLNTSPVIASPTLSGPTFTGTAAGSVFTASTSLAIAGGTALTSTNQTGTGSLALATSATLVTPTLTTPSISNATLSGITTAALTKVTPQALAVVSANYTTTATTLAGAGVITGLNFTGPVSLASKWSYHCEVVYSQATAAAANLWGVITAGTAPNSLGMGAEVLTNQTGSMNSSAVNGISGATATLVVTSTPSAFGAIGTSADMFTAHFWGTLEATSNSTPSQVGIAVATGNASDALTVYQDLSSCWWF